MRLGTTTRTYTPPIVADLPLQLDPALADRVARSFDREGKVVRGLHALTSIEDRDVGAVDLAGGPLFSDLEALGARLHAAPLVRPLSLPFADQSMDVVIGAWSTFRGADPLEIVEVDRVLRPAGRLLVVHDYGRDDVSLLVGDRPEFGSWGRRGGPFTEAGFKIRVLHCWWTFETVDDAAAFIGEAFGGAGESLAAGLHRPRLSHNIAIYHRARPDRPG